ncbi:MAG: prolyl oligopeptidase family serine peptidase [Gemmatimonadaceae bacterium]
MSLSSASLTALLAFCSQLLLTPSLVSAQEARSDALLTVDHYLDYEQISDPRISPDGKQVIYTRRWVNVLEDRWDSGLWLMNADGSHNRFLVKGSNAVWSPDGTRVAYLADGEPKGTQIFVRWMDTEGAGSQVTRLLESPADVKWSPDGKSLGFTQFVPKKSPWEISMPAAPAGAKWTSAPRIVQQLHFRQDRRGFTDPGYRHMFVISADGGTPQQITSGDWSVGARFDVLDGPVDWSWTPDSKSIVVEGMNDSTADMNYRNANIYLVDVATRSVRRLTEQSGVWTSPAVSPDGKRIAFLGYPATKASYQASEIYLMNLDGSGVQKITSLDRDPGNPVWSNDGKALYFDLDDHGTVNIASVSPAGTSRRLTTGNHVVTLGSVSRTGIAVGTRSSYQSPADIVRIDLRGSSPSVSQITAVNADMLARINLSPVEKFTYTSTGGTKVDGWIVKPAAFDQTRKYPLIMEIHGGPHGAYTSGFNFSFQNFAANGFVVLYTNPRGSTGYGSAFGNAIEHAYPSVDYDDLMAAVDTVIGRGYIDTRSMFVGGCSGGGVLSSWVIGHTQRFAAAAVRCPVIDWVSMAGQTDIPLFTYNFFDAPFWEKPEQWLKQSPLMYVGHVTTPTLIMTGELDRRTPIPQSEEYYAALKMRGVPTTLLRFEGEYHGTGSKPSNFMRTQLYMMSWYKRWAGRGSSTTASVAP